MMTRQEMVAVLRFRHESMVAVMINRLFDDENVKVTVF